MELLETPTILRLREKTHTLPMEPGVYLMKNKEGEIIYVGKAKLLKNRVSSYFVNLSSHLPKVAKMVSQVENFDYIVVSSEFEALVLECSLIKLHSPKYNILLKDDKGYHYVRVTREDYPRISAAKQKLSDDADYLGPYTSSYTVTQAVEEVNKVFRLPTCNKKFPQDFKKERPCLNYHLHLCSGVCTGKISKAAYAQEIKNAVGYLKRGSKELVAGLEKQMEEAAENLEFERAAALRDRIAAIKKLGEGQRVIMTDVKEQDVIAAVSNRDAACVTVIKFREARLVDKQDFLFYDAFDLDQVRNEFLTRYYNLPEDIPNSILLDEDFPDREVVLQLLCERRGSRTFLTVAHTADQNRAVGIARGNALEWLSKAVGRTAHEVAGLEELQKLLGLPKTPEYIESYDISNLGDTGIVAGMVVFENGRPLKSAYRKFSLKEVVTQDDYASMREVITRRFRRYEEEKETGKGFGRLPDLILLDGGKGHVAAVLPVVREFGLDVPVYGMVKDSRHRTRAIAADGKEVSVAGYQAAFTLMGKLQEEVHRYAITYQRQKRKKQTFALKLTEVPGIGQKKAEALLLKFGTTAALKKASAEELAAAAKVKLEKGEELKAFIEKEF